MNAPKWHVTSQSLQSDLSDAGTGFVPVWEVRYMIDDGPASGTTGFVRIPAAQYNADTVKKTIDAITIHNHSVAGL